jgi:uncharacterized protein YceK
MLRVFGPATLLHLTAANPMFPLVRAPTSPVWNVARHWACDAPALDCCKLRSQSFVHLKALCGMLRAFRHATLQHLTAANLMFPLVHAPTSPVWNVARFWACNAPALDCCNPNVSACQCTYKRCVECCAPLPRLRFLARGCCSLGIWSAQEVSHIHSSA